MTETARNIVSPGEADLTVTVTWRDGRKWNWFIGGETYRDLKGPVIADIAAGEVRQIITDQEGAR